MIEIGKTYFYIRPNRKIVQAEARKWRVNSDQVPVEVQMCSTKTGLREWVATSKVFGSLGEARAALKQKPKKRWRFW
jgi:hypothetical protein